MIRFALVAASTLGFMLTAALCSLLLPLRGRPKPRPRKIKTLPRSGQTLRVCRRMRRPSARPVPRPLGGCA